MSAVTTRTATPSTATVSTVTLTRRPRWLSVVGVLGVVAMGFTVWLGLWITPPDQFQGNLARLLYIHPAIATVALYWVGLVAAGGSLLYLWPRTRSLFWDRLAASSVEVRRASQVHQTPHTGRPQIAPVTSVSAANTAPTSTEAAASRSQNNERVRGQR